MSSSESLRIIFAGTPDFAASALEALIKSRHDVVAVYTQPDRPAGRGRQLRASPVKELALKHAIPVIQPDNFKKTEDQNKLKSFESDVMVVAAYGLILPQIILDAPRFGCLNIHASLLPRWRGAAPIQRAIAAGDPESGITIMQMNAGLDTGDILSLTPYAISVNETGGSLHDQLADMGAKEILNTLNNIETNNLEPVKQDDSFTTYAHKLNKAEAEINWQLSAKEIESMIRAFNPWPVAYTHLNNKVLRLWQAKVLTENSDLVPGTVISFDKHGIHISCGGGSVLQLLILQPSGSKAMDVASFLNGHAKQLQVGSLLAATPD